MAISMYRTADCYRLYLRHQSRTMGRRSGENLFAGKLRKALKKKDSKEQFDDLLLVGLHLVDDVLVIRWVPVDVESSTPSSARFEHLRRRLR